MRTTIDRAGRVVIPKELRRQIGLEAGEVEILVDGTAVRIEAVAGAGLVERAGRLVIPAAGSTLSDEDVRALRDANQR